MTTRVIVEACCSSDKEIAIDRSGELTILQDGERHELVVYDDVECSVKEVSKIVQSIGGHGQDPDPDKPE